MKLSVSHYPVIDLFAGAGGMSLGAEMVGGEVRLSVEQDSLCCDTLQRNRTDGRHFVLNSGVEKLKGSDLRKLARIGKTDPLIIIGGPPCQPFSKAAYWTDSGEDSRFRRARARGKKVSRPVLDYGPRPDDRRDLVREFVRLVQESRASGFVFENVPSILHPRNQGLVDDLVTAFRNAGFKVAVGKSNAAQFGVPQVRHRVFILGHRRTIPQLPGTRCAKLNGKCVTAGEALKGLDAPKFFEPEEVVHGKWAAHLKEIPPGWNYKWHTAWAGHSRPTFETETKFWTFLLKLDPKKPSWTIAACPGPWVGPFHWSSRRLRTVELAALQGFPRGYFFAGTRRDKVRQIGNAVPPKLAAAAIGEVIAAETGSDRKAALNNISSRPIPVAC